jgi:ATP synthase protein I
MTTNRRPPIMMSHPVVPLARAASLAAGVTGVLALAISAIAAGGQGVRGAALGLVVAVAYVSITLLVGRLTLTGDPNVMMAVAMGSFLVKLVVFAVALTVLKDHGVFSHVSSLAFALTAVATAIATMIAEALAFLHTRRPVWDETPAGVG